MDGETESDPESESDSKRWRLAGMMALIYAVQGAWWPVLAVHLQDLGISGRGRGWIFATLAMASVVTPLSAGQLADRLLPTQRLLALIYALGTGFLAMLAFGPVLSFPALFTLFLTYWLISSPSYGLANSLVFRNLHRPAEEFGGIRLWGTVGWMSIGWLVTVVMLALGHAGNGTHGAFAVATALSAVFAAYCLTLPHTPPLATGGKGRVLDFRVLGDLAARPGVKVFMATAFGVSLTTPFVYQTVPTYLRAVGLAPRWIASAMTLSQVLEVGSLALLPAILRRARYRGSLAIGIGAWVLYYAVFASRPALWVALLVLPLNGVSLGCFTVAGQMFLDSQAPRDRRAGAQALHVMATSGVGSFLGNLLAGELMTRHGGVGTGVFIVPMLINTAMLFLLLMCFRTAEHPRSRAAAPRGRDRSRRGEVALAP